MKKHLLGAVAAAAVSLALTPVSANAAQYITNLEYNQTGFLDPALGTVTLTEGAGYVDVLVAFGAAIQNIVDTGSHVSFAFNLLDSAGNPTDPVSVGFIQPAGGGDYSYSGIFTVTSPGPHHTTITSPGYYDQAPFKHFTNAITNDGGGNNAAPPPLEFRLYAPGISFLGAGGDHFTSTPNGTSGDIAGFTGGWWFAADVQNTSGTTFTVAGRDYCTVGVDCAATPEPATWAMMLMGFGGMGALLRRNRRVARLAVA